MQPTPSQTHISASHKATPRLSSPKSSLSVFSFEPQTPLPIITVSTPNDSSLPATTTTPLSTSNTMMLMLQSSASHDQQIKVIDQQTTPEHTAQLRTHASHSQAPLQQK